MSDFLDSTFWLFLALGWGFALVTALMSWWRVDHGLAEVQIARMDRDKYAKQVEGLKQSITAMPDEWPAIYIGLRKVALENIADGRSLMQMYLHVVRSHSRYRDIEMVLPDLTLPTELEASEPPPVPLLDTADEEKESVFLGEGLAVKLCDHSRQTRFQSPARQRARNRPPTLVITRSVNSNSANWLGSAGLPQHGLRARRQTHTIERHDAV
jgi:hypothetical protein